VQFSERLCRRGDRRRGTENKYDARFLPPPKIAHCYPLSRRCQFTPEFDGKNVKGLPAQVANCRKIAISNNVGGVKRFLGTLQHGLEKERHFALVDGLRFPTLARV
jgi:hypothetical protein